MANDVSDRGYMNIYIKLILAMSTLVFSVLSVAESSEFSAGKMIFPNDENGDVLRRMQDSNFEFSKIHDVEFFAVFRTVEMADAVALQYLADSKSGDKLRNIETRPAYGGGMELILVKPMLLTHDNVTAFENKLASRVADHKGYLNGWGVLQK